MFICPPLPNILPLGIIGVRRCWNYMNLAKKGLCRLLVASVAFLSIHSARAEMSATEQAVTDFRRAELASQLYSLGVERAFAEQRVAAMSDEEIDALIGKLGSLPAGGQMSVGGGSSGCYASGRRSALPLVLRSRFPIAACV